MKLSIAIADTYALPNAYVVFRGFEKYIPLAASMGYNGVEIAVKSAGEINPAWLKHLLQENNVEVSCISTGQVFADGGLSFTNPNVGRRKTLKSIFCDIIDLASEFGGLVNIGRVRGNIYEAENGYGLELFLEMIRELAFYAARKNVKLLLEPVNRYEIDFVHTVAEGAALLETIAAPNIKLMPDTFHMNIEDKQIGKELFKWSKYIGYIHLADSNRLAPGQGHTDFDNLFFYLNKAAYAGWLSVEILPKPSPEKAAQQAIDFLLPYMQQTLNNSFTNSNGSENE
ncbi:MAG: sugar phosphate isomerase/epimerase family protein [Sediminibacterium sp.]